MTQAQKDADIPLEEFILIRDFIHEKSGIYFAESKAYLLANRLSKRMAELGLQSYRDYYMQIKYDPTLGEFNKLMNLVTTNETSFFRNEPQLNCFAEEVLPILTGGKHRTGTPRVLRIWSAGCSTGEEPYTLAMMILEKLGKTSGWTIEIFANDISEQVLQRARIGEYTGITLRNMPPHYLNKYFVRVGDLYRVSADVRSLVKFAQINLNDPRRQPVPGQFDVIFCRNVMIYFSDEIKQSLVRNFFNSLVPGGYLFIGHSETLHGISKAYKLVYFKHALVYQKDAVAIEHVTSVSKPMASLSGVTPPMAAAAGSTKARELLRSIGAGANSSRTGQKEG